MITKLQLSQQASWIAKYTASWAGDLLNLPETIKKPASDDTIQQFCQGVRDQLEIIERWHNE